MAFLLIIARGGIENQRVAILVQWVTWVFGRWKNRLHTKKICEGEFLFCEGAKVEKLEEEIWKHQQLLKILLQVLGWTNISKNNHSKTWLRVFNIVFLPPKQWWRFLKIIPERLDNRCTDVVYLPSETRPTHLEVLPDINRHFRTNTDKNRQFPTLRFDDILYLQP